MFYDLLIKDGFIVDGTGNPGYYGDIAVKDDKIKDIRSELDVEAEKVIDASGMVVAPGFIDPHVHEELATINKRNLEVFLREGVTTIINGNCGHSVTPYSSENILEYTYNNGLISEKAMETMPKWDDFEGYVEVMKEDGVNINMGTLLGHGTIRWSVMGGAKDREPTEEEEKEIKKLVREGMEQGAMGISTGLAYIPSRYSDTEELIEVSKEVEKYDGVYTSHIRYYEGELDAVKEAIKIGEKSGVRVQVSHLTPTSPESFDEILSARDRGVEVAVDTIPKSSGHCTRKDRMLQIIMALNDYFFDMDVDEVKESLKTPEGREKIREDKAIFDTDRDKIYIINTDDPDMENRNVKELAEKRDMDPDDLLIELLANDNDQITFWRGGLNREDFPGDPYPDNIVNNPLVMVGSDRIKVINNDFKARYELFRPGAFPIFFDLFKQGGARLEDIVRRVTSLPARQFRLSNRGLLAKDQKADITIFDEEEYDFPSSEERDYSEPRTMASGVKHVIVNGELALEDGKVNESRSGEMIAPNGEVL